MTTEKKALEINAKLEAMSAGENNENLISTNELAKKLSVHRMTVVRMAKDGRIPFLKISDTEYRYNYEKVITALESNK